MLRAWPILLEGDCHRTFATYLQRISRWVDLVYLVGDRDDEAVRLLLTTLNCLLLIINNLKIMKSKKKYTCDYCKKTFVSSKFFKESHMRTVNH